MPFLLKISWISLLHYNYPWFLLLIICSVLNFSGWIWLGNWIYWKKSFSNFYCDGFVFGKRYYGMSAANCTTSVSIGHVQQLLVWSTLYLYRYNMWFSYCLIHDAMFICVIFIKYSIPSLLYIYTLLANIRLLVYIHVRLGFEFLWTVLNQELYQHDFNKPYNVS